MNRLMLFMALGSLLLLLPSCEEEELLAIENVFMYQYFNEKGYTNSEAYAMFKQLNTDETPQKKLNTAQVETLKEIIVNSKQKDLFPGKTGVDVLFFIITDAEGGENIILLSSNLLRDYTNSKDYWVNEKDTEKVRVLMNDLRNP